MTQAADVRRRPPDVHDERVGALGQERGAAHRVGRPGGEAVDGEGLGDGREHDRAVVLGEVERRGDPARPQRVGEGARRPLRQIHERRVEQRRVLALEEAEAAEAVGERDGDARALLAEDLRRLLLARRVQRGEDRGDADRGDPRLADAARRGSHAARIERDEGPAVVLVAALQHHDLAADDRREILGPVAEGLEGGARGKPDADRGDARQLAVLDDGVGEVRGAEHHRADRREAPGGPEQLGEGISHARGHVRGRRRLDRVEDALVLQQHCVGVRAADVYTDSASGRLRRAPAPDGRALSGHGPQGSGARRSGSQWAWPAGLRRPTVGLSVRMAARAPAPGGRALSGRHGTRSGSPDRSRRRAGRRARAPLA